MQQQLPSGFALQGGKYRIVKAIGQGGFGITYRAEMMAEVTGALGGAKVRVPVAIKEFFFAEHCTRDPQTFAVLTNEALTGARMFAQFKAKLNKEATILSRLRHDNIVSVIDIFEENGTAYMVMDFVEGRSLEQVIKTDGHLDPARAVRYASQLCYAVDAIHRAQVLHLDIKPGNILIDNDDNVRVIDFGISKQYDDSHQETSTTPVGISKGYAPIEQYTDMSRFTPQTDIYAIGATIYYMLTGVTPAESILRVASEQLAPIASVNPGVPAHVIDAVSQAMSIRADDRPASAAALSAMLNAVNISDIPPIVDPVKPDEPPISHTTPVTGPFGPAPKPRPGGLAITMLCIGLTFGLVAIVPTLMLFSGSIPDGSVFTTIITALTVCAWAAMLEVRHIHRAVTCIIAAVASAAFIFYYSSGFDYLDFTEYSGGPVMMAGALSAMFAATLIAFFSYRVRWTGYIAILLTTAATALWCTAY